MNSCACACVSQFSRLDLCTRADVSLCLYGLLNSRLWFSVFVWTLVLALIFLSVYMDIQAIQALIKIRKIHFYSHVFPIINS